MTPQPLVAGWVVARENRFVLQVRLADGRVERAYLPNTARLRDLLAPDAEVLLRPDDAATRRTRFTVTRVWDGTWVALDAAGASRLVADALRSGQPLPGWPPITAVREEVTVGPHRFDLAVSRQDGRNGLVEVKSLSHARDGVAPLSGTPSTRGVGHLAALVGHARAGTPAAVAFVVQRGDVEVLDLDAPADPGWRTAVQAAHRGGVHLVAFRTEVTCETVRLGHPLDIRGTCDRPG